MSETVPPRTIAVTGTGRVSVAPDVADLRLGVTVTEQTVEAARAANARAMAGILGALRAAPIEDRDIQTSGLSLNPAYDYSGPTPRLTGYTLTNTVAVTIRELGQVGPAIDGSLEAGATSLDSIAFRVQDPTAAEQQARQAAVADARAKAEVLAAAAGVSLSRVESISEAGGAIPYPAFRETAKMAMADASTPIETGSNEIVVTVAVTYLID